ncbi:MAG: heme ABC transporter ATP-binding protein [Gammaproteobacteria bacterium]|nr:MAG: heme ABC transporter ATP-binding protein [Gammaproteobacteria bacterium]
MSILSVHKVSAAPWGTPLLKDLSFSLDAGTITAIIGPNGAGKSSLLHLLAGGHGLSAGELLLQGRPLGDYRLAERARHIGVLPQQASLNFPFSVEEVVSLGRTPHASGRLADRQIVQEVLEAVDINAFAQRIYTELSGGERQRVQLARALAQIWREQDAPGRVLLLDEPTSAMDLAHQQRLRHLLKEVAASGCAVVLITHDFNMACSCAETLIVINNGAAVAAGTVNDVVTPRMFMDVFGVSVYINRDLAFPQVLIT